MESFDSNCDISICRLGCHRGITMTENTSRCLYAYKAFGCFCDTSWSNSPVWWQFTGRLNKKPASGPGQHALSWEAVAGCRIAWAGCCKPPHEKLTCSLHRQSLHIFPAWDPPYTFPLHPLALHSPPTLSLPVSPPLVTSPCFLSTFTILHSSCYLDLWRNQRSVSSLQRQQLFVSCRTQTIIYRVADLEGAYQILRM